MNTFSVHIKPLKKEQASISYAWRNDPAIWKFTGKKPDKIITQKIEEEWLEKVLKESNSKRFGIWADGQYIGNIQLTAISKGQNSEYHIFIGKRDFWGKGIAKLATLQILRFAKFTLLLKEVFLKVHVNHDSAIQLYKSCGFKVEREEEDWLIMKIDFSSDWLNPKLSVFMMTYNHALYIESAINGILQQQCGFDFDIVIGDDFSLDGTRAILLKFAEQYPGRFKLLLHSKNIGAYQNQNAVFNACKGEFVAICEGDDYWDDPHKLQKQVDFLEANSDYAISFHEVVRIDGAGNPLNKPVLGTERWKDLNQDQLITGELIPSVSVVFRTDHLQEFLNIRKQVKNGDTLLFAMLGQYGKAHFHPDIQPANYRIHEGGVWTSIDIKSKKEALIQTFDTLRRVVKFENKHIVDKVLFDKYLDQFLNLDYPLTTKIKFYYRIWRFSIANGLSGYSVKLHFQFVRKFYKKIIHG